MFVGHAKSSGLIQLGPQAGPPHAPNVSWPFLCLKFYIPFFNLYVLLAFSLIDAVLGFGSELAPTVLFQG